MSIPPVNTTALLILQQSRTLAGPGDSGLADLGVSGHAGSGTGSPFTQARAKISDAMFSVTRIDPTAAKIKLIERLGEEFGIKLSDYASVASYGADLKRAVEALKAKPGSAQAIMAIEKKLGLDKLGISLDGLVDATIDPNGDGGKKLDAALKKQAGGTAKGEAIIGLPRLDDIGIYGR
ncbi:hypothetical protein HB777_07065 [Mesorhizobium loti]|nr:hypothetical protein HB777_07065 [Mesorhizobium loti]